MITAAPAQGTYWDTDGDTAGAGGPSPTGNWGGSNWSTSEDGDEPTGSWAAGSTAVFSAGDDATGAYTVTVDGTQQIGGMHFQNGTPTITGGTLEMVSISPVSVASDVTATIDSALSGTNFFYRTGSGTLVLSGDNSGATGGMLLNDGITQFENADAINGTARNITINNPGTMAFGSSFGAASVVQTALANRVAIGASGTIAADNYASANFDFDAAGLTAASLGAVGTVNYTGTLTPNDGVYRLGGGGGTLTLNSSLATESSLVVAGPGTVQLNGYDATVTGFSSIGSGAILENANVLPITLSVSNTTANSFAGSLRDGADSGSLSLVKMGSGALTLSGSNDFSGDIEIDGGTLEFSTLDAWGGEDKNVTFTGTAELRPEAGGYVGGTLTVNADVTATINRPSGTHTFTETTGAGDIIFSVSGTGTRRLLLGDASTFTGTLRVLLASNANQGNNINLQFSDLGDDGAIQFQNTTGGNNNSAQALTVAFAGEAPLTFDTRQIQILARTDGNWSIRDNTIANNSASTNNIWVINTDLLMEESQSRNLRLSGSNQGENAFNGVISDGNGTINVVKAGAGKWILSGNNTYSGVTTVEAGTLGLRDDYSLPHEGTLNRTGGTIHIEGRARVADLQAGGVSLPAGVYGSTDSNAQFNGEMLEIDAETEIANFFSGTGLLFVDTPFPAAGTLIIVQ